LKLVGAIPYIFYFANWSRNFYEIFNLPKTFKILKQPLFIIYLYLDPKTLEIYKNRPKQI